MGSWSTHSGRPRAVSRAGLLPAPPSGQLEVSHAHSWQIHGPKRSVLAGTVIAANADPFDGSYAGSMTLESKGTMIGGGSAPCVEGRPVSMRIEHGNVTIWYADWGKNIIHFRGKLDPTGNIQLWHTNGDGTRSLLVGQIGDTGFSGYMARDRGACPYKLVMPTKAV